MQLFQKPATAASLVLHLQAINLYLGRNIFLEGGRSSQRPSHDSAMQYSSNYINYCLDSPRLLSLVILVQNLKRFIFFFLVASGQSCLIPTFHSLILAFFTGPLGLLSHHATKVFWKGRRRAAEAIILQSDGGTITLMPYEEVWDQ